MKSASRLFWAVGVAFTLESAHDPRSLAAAQQRTPVSVTRIYSGPDGQTHAEQVDVTLAPGAIFGRDESEMTIATSSYLVRFSPGIIQDWHPAAERRYLITLSGRGEVELVGGQKINLEPGRVLQAEDVTGKGHITRTASKEDWIVLFVQLGPKRNQ